MNFIKIATIAGKVFSEFCEIKQYKIQRNHMMIVNYNVGNPKLKINEEK